MTKLNITWIKRDQKTSAAGKPYTSLSLRATEYGERYLSGFGSKDNQDWAVGSQVEVEIIEKKVGDKVYLNFETPKKAEIATNEVKQELVGQSLRLGAMNAKLDKILDHLSGARRLDRTSDGSEMPTI